MQGEWVGVVDHASRMSDRWLFLAMLVVMGIVLYLVARHYMKLHQDLISDFKSSRERYETNMIHIVEQQAASNARTIAVIEENTATIKAVNFTIGECRRQAERRP